MSQNAKEMLEFIKKSPSCFHVVSNLKEQLCSAGFEELSEQNVWKIENGKKYFVCRNGSSIISFAIPASDCGKKESKRNFDGFLITASHSDSPSFKIKENPEMNAAGFVRLNVEKYGGMLLNPWFDRPLSFAGRVIYTTEDGDKTKICQKLVNIDKDLLLIPNLAVHMSRDANDGKKIDLQKEIVPVISQTPDFSFVKYLADAAQIEESNIQGYDLFLYNRDEGRFWGADDEFISSPKLDDLECVWTTFKGFLKGAQNMDCAKIGQTSNSGNVSNNTQTSKNDGQTCNASKVLVHVVYDNEEVGSASRQGAASTFLKDVLERINFCFGGSLQEYQAAVANSFLVSADNAHSVHPNYVSAADPVNQPKVNQGVVIKFNASQKYTSDGISGVMFKAVCQKAGVPFQVFTNNSNIQGGSTLGNISTSQVSVRSVDIGLAQWAMHSPNESAGERDVDYMINAIESFYSDSVCCYLTAD